MRTFVREGFVVLFNKIPKLSCLSHLQTNNSVWGLRFYKKYDFAENRRPFEISL